MNQQHEIGGRMVELKRAEPKRPLQLAVTGSGREKTKNRGIYLL